MLLTFHLLICKPLTVIDLGFSTASTFCSSSSVPSPTYPVAPVKIILISVHLCHVIAHPIQLHSGSKQVELMQTGDIGIESHANIHHPTLSNALPRSRLGIARTCSALLSLLSRFVIIGRSR